MQIELLEARAKLVMLRGEATDMPAEAKEDWQSLRDELQKQLQSVTKHAAVLRGPESTTGAASPAARLAEAETAVQESHRQAQQLAKKCGDMQEEIDVLQRQRAAALKAAAVAVPAILSAEAQADVAEELSAEHADSKGAPDSTESDGPCGDGWSVHEDEWGKAEASADRTTQKKWAASESAKVSTAAAAAAPQSFHVAAEVAVQHEPGPCCEEADTQGSDPSDGSAPVPGHLDEPDFQSVLAYVQRDLRNEAHCGTATSLTMQLRGLFLEKDSDTRRRSPSLGPGDLVSCGEAGATATLRLAEREVAEHTTHRTPAEKVGSVTAPNSMSTAGCSPFHAADPTDSTRDGDGNMHGKAPNSPAALSFNPLFDHLAMTPDAAAWDSAVGVQQRGSKSYSQAGGMLAPPLLPWESLNQHQLAASLRLLQVVSAALAHPRAQNGSVAGSGGAGAANAAEVPQTLASLREAVTVMEQNLVVQIAELGARMAALAPPCKLSGLSLHSLPTQTSNTSGRPVAPASPRSPDGSPVASASIFGLHSTLQELLCAHQALLEACDGHGGEPGRRWHGESKRLAAEAEAELQRLQEVHVQQETEVSIQWHEKQQVQSAAQVQIAAKEQVCLSCCPY